MASTFFPAPFTALPCADIPLAAVSAILSPSERDRYHISADVIHSRKRHAGYADIIFFNKPHGTPPA